MTVLDDRVNPSLSPSPLTQSAEWRQLCRHRDALASQQLSDMIAGDKKRLDTCELALGGLRLNYALNRVKPETMVLLTQLALSRNVEGWRERMWRGDKINSTENRAALHVALRQSSDTPMRVDGVDVVADVRATRQRIAAFVTAVRDGHHRGATGKTLRHVVNIGIGGSDLGPRLAARALAQNVSGIEAHFVANADAFELVELFKKLDPAETLFVVVSKTFTTLETMLNAETARAWLAQNLGSEAVAKHMVAVSANLKGVEDFGIAPDNVFPMWDWVGGRFSLWSAVGLTLELAIGTDHFENMLHGAEAMDRHFKETPLQKNMPVVLAMLGIWSQNFLGCAAHAVLPYSERLRDLPRYLQQLEMESNGKSVGRNGEAVEAATAPVIFGESGTVGQHSFHQWLHQGTDVASVDFIAVLHDDFDQPRNHQALLSNMAAQAVAFAFGQPHAAVPCDIYAGNRGSNILTLARLDPAHLGMLLALYEHKVFVQSVIWGINPFDQPGVELGKRLASSLAKGAAAKSKSDVFAEELYARLL